MKDGTYDSIQGLPMQPNWTEIAIGVVVTTLGGFVTRLWSKLDAHEARQSEIEKTCITRAELDQRMREMRDDRNRMHSENQDVLSEIRDDIKYLMRGPH